MLGPKLSHSSWAMQSKFLACNAENWSDVGDTLTRLESDSIAGSGSGSDRIGSRTNRHTVCLPLSIANAMVVSLWPSLRSAFFFVNGA